MPAHVDTPTMPTYRRPLGVDLVRMPVGFPEPLHAWLRVYGERIGLPAAELVRRAVVEYRDRVDGQLELFPPMTGQGFGR